MGRRGRSYQGGPQPEGALLEHWDGQHWHSLISSPGQTLVSLSAISPTDVWMVARGQNDSGQISASLAIWDGHLWHNTPRRLPDYDPFQARIAQVVAVNDNDVWLAGSIADQALVAHWDGTSWSLVTQPLPAHGHVSGLAVSGRAVWAVGLVAGDHDRPLLARQFRCR